MALRSGSGSIVILVYLLLAFLGEAAAYFAGRFIDARYPEIGLIAFLTMFMAVLILAFPIALQVTRPAGET